MIGDVERALQILHEGSPDAIERALATLQDTIFSFSMKACGHPEDAEDTMQDVLLKTVSYLDRFDNARALAVWLYKVARNRCLTHRRKTRTVSASELSLEALMPSGDELKLLASPAGDPESHASANELGAWLQEAVLQLPSTCREVLVLHDMEGFSYREVAEITGSREATVRVRLHRARLFVRRSCWQHLAPARTAGSAQLAKPAHCRSMFARLSDYLDGVLDEAFCVEMQRHLSDCPPCVTFLQSLQKTIDLCRNYRPADRPHIPSRITKELLLKYEEARATLQSMSLAT